MANELDGKVYSRLPASEKRTFLDIRKAIVRCRQTIQSCDEIIAERQSESAQRTKEAAQVQLTRLDERMEELALRLNFEFGDPMLPGVE